MNADEARDRGLGGARGCMVGIWFLIVVLFLAIVVSHIARG